MDYKVLLLTSGIGSRLGSITNYTNKSLVRIGEKPIICHVLDRYYAGIEIVVTLGHYGNQVKDFLQIAYPNRKFTFVQVDNFNGPGSSLVYSLLQAESALECPFVYHACDTLIPSDKILVPSENWLGGCKSANSVEYTSLSVLNDHVIQTHEKGEEVFDYIYIGLAGVYDYQKFFATAKALYQKRKNDSQISDIDISNVLIREGVSFKYINFPSWLDAGNIDGLKKAREIYKSDIEVLCKDTESIFILNKQVVKFFYDKKVVQNRVARANILKNLVPNIISQKDNFYSYEYAEGKILSSIISENLMDTFLTWAKTNLWLKRKEANTDFYKTCMNFYFAKTRERTAQFLENYGMADSSEIINSTQVPKISDMLDSIPEKWLCDVPCYNFHGDFILDNVLFDDNTFVLLDWRQDFGGDLNNGDIYYDLAKLNHNLIFNHEIINNGNFLVKKDQHIKVDLLMSYNLSKCREVLNRFLHENNFDVKKVNLLSAIIWLNMAPLHSYPVDMFLYYFGKLNLHKELRSLNYEL